MTLRCRVPAKLILSGEHAVVYGQPALSMAIDLTSECELEFQTNDGPLAENQIQIALTDYQLNQAWSFQQAWSLAMACETRYLNHTNSALSIRQVCQTPFDLPLLCFFHFEQTFGLKPGCWQVKLHSQAWRGRGLGSSAAIITSLLSALFHAHAIQDRACLIDMATQIESRQHGRSSGIDPATIAQGGLIHYQPKSHPVISTLPLQPFQAWLIDTGEPQATTGECVDWVKNHYADEGALWLEFGVCTEQMHQAWLAQNAFQFAQAMQTNQGLLEQIQVVPTSISQFINQLRIQTGWIAKLCGAGTVRGDQAGVILAFHPDHNDIPSQQQNLVTLCQQWGFHAQAIQLAPHGVQCEEQP